MKAAKLTAYACTKCKTLYYAKPGADECCDESFAKLEVARAERGFKAAVDAMNKARARLRKVCGEGSDEKCDVRNGNCSCGAYHYEW